MPPTWQTLAAFLLAYLAGSIPFGLLLGFTRGVDIREHGSGNIGATNAYRVLGKRLGILCFILDVAKGLIPVTLLALWLGLLGERFPQAPRAFLYFALAVATIMGHMFPVWLRFKGGKGVATGFGSLLGVFPHMTAPALGALALWIAVLRATKYVGVSSCIAAISIPLFAALFAALLDPVSATEIHGGPATAGARVLAAWPFWTIGALLAALVLWKHRANIRRTLAGTEPRVGQRKPASS